MENKWRYARPYRGLDNTGPAFRMSMFALNRLYRGQSWKLKS